MIVHFSVSAAEDGRRKGHLAMRIALLSHEYPPFTGGGIGTYATLMARSFAEAGHELHVVTNRFRFGSEDPRDAEPDIQDGNLWVHRVAAWDDNFEPAGAHASINCPQGELSREFSPYLYYTEKLAERLEQLHREFDFEVVEAPECAAEGYAPLRWRRSGLAFEGLPITVCCHSPIDEIYRYNLYSRNNFGFWRRKTLEDDSVCWADGAHAPSGLMLKIVSERLGLTDHPRPQDVLPLPMDFSEIPEPAPVDRSDGPRLFFVGRLEPRKGVRYLVDAAVRLMRNGHPNLKVEMVGRDCDAGEVPGQMSDFLKSRVPAKFKHNLIFPGYTPRAQLFAKYRAATACVFAPEWDNFPYTCVEAMASGACVVGSNYSGIAEMVEHEKSGLLFKAGRVDSLASMIRRAIEDTELNSSIRTAAMIRIRELCDPMRAVRDRVTHYERVVEFVDSRERTVVQVPTNPVPLAVLVAVDTDGTGDVDRRDVMRTIESVTASAAAAHYRPEFTVTVPISATANGENGIGGEKALVIDQPNVRVVSPFRTDMSSARSFWLDEGKPFDAEALLTIRAGEELTANALATWRTRLDSDSTLGWVSSRVLPAAAETNVRLTDLPEAFVDFTLPLGLIDARPMPPALISTSVLGTIGFWDTNMPEAWSDWDLRLRMIEAGFHGDLLPLWLIKAIPRAKTAAEETLDLHRRSIMVERIMVRCPGIFREHGHVLWEFDAFGEQDSFAVRS
jgi:glycosyltransferase involved in cell wall biosynthesis